MGRETTCGSTYDLGRWRCARPAGHSDDIHDSGPNLPHAKRWFGYQADPPKPSLSPEEVRRLLAEGDELRREAERRTAPMKGPPDSDDVATMRQTIRDMEAAHRAEVDRLVERVKFEERKRQELKDEKQTTGKVAVHHSRRADKAEAELARVREEIGESYKVAVEGSRTSPFWEAVRKHMGLLAARTGATLPPEPPVLVLPPLDESIDRP